MMDDDEWELEFSPLSGEVSRDGMTISVQIYHLLGTRDGWMLEVIDRGNTSKVWDNLFATDEEAYAEFYRMLEGEGIRAFAERRAERPQ